ncbi:hypothetical protein EGW08_019295 [Elysia chlorotica]|uniref:Major facilitator superfamily (MFS) profile domain-containing protein n=1 Tax=Elysia chlorotica TaxID=188477 RepID=A0A3S0ZE59_ELYCH|nr:hypothetical protein EGW08_019295 [Elysia chlorotica]
MIIGTLVNSSAIFMSCFSTSIYMLIALVGVQSGIGLGMMYLPFVSVVPLHFKKKRSLAMGIATCGMGIGTFIYPPLFTWLEEQMHWRGTMIVLAGIILNVAVCGALIRPIDPNQQQASEENNSEKTGSSHPESGYSSNIAESLPASFQTFSNGLVTKSHTSDNISLASIDYEDKCAVWTTEHPPFAKDSILHENTLSATHDSALCTNNDVQVWDTEEMTQQGVNYTADEHITTSFTHQKERTPSIASSKCPGESASSVKKISFVQSCKNLMKNPYFIAFAFSNFLTSLTFLMPPVYIVDRALENGVEKAKAALALSMYGAGNLFGRLGFGFLADHVLDSLILNSICLIICGVSTCLSPLCGSNAVLHGVYGFTFGTFIGGYMTLTPLILVELMGVALLNSSFGIVLFFRAGGMLLGTPIPGWIYDATNSYTTSFVLHGIIIGVSGLILMGLKVAVVRSKRRDATDAVAVTDDEPTVKTISIKQGIDGTS